MARNLKLWLRGRAVRPGRTRPGPPADDSGLGFKFRPLYSRIPRDLPVARRLLLDGEPARALRPVLQAWARAGGWGDKPLNRPARQARCRRAAVRVYYVSAVSLERRNAPRPARPGGPAARDPSRSLRVAAIIAPASESAAAAHPCDAPCGSAAGNRRRGAAGEGRRVARAALRALTAPSLRSRRACSGTRVGRRPARAR